MGIPQKPITFRVDEALIKHIELVQFSRDPALSQADAIRLILEEHRVLNMLGILNRRENTFQQVLRLLSSVRSECNSLSPLKSLPVKRQEKSA